ncbi:hypothetical protein KJZ63_02190 [Patescibacteria group bacterium]|nr:hypothetical protein [Patescibacteria group bacterium]
MSNQAERYAVLGEHFYQPTRKATHHRLADQVTTSDGINWNKVIAEQCYIPQTQRGTLNEVSFDFFATIRREMLGIAPEEAIKLKEAMKSRGVGDPFLHVLLPDLSYQDKKILIEAGYLAFQRETGVAPSWFWPPETALDDETLRVLAEVGYKGVLCAPEQIDGIGGDADSRPIEISLASGHKILALPFDRPFSSGLAFSNKSNADDYTWQNIVPRIMRLPQSQPLVGWTDGETFGHHAKFADLFLHHLATVSLPTAGVSMLGINEIDRVWEPEDYAHGVLRQRTAWSCPHGDLVRWHGACPCDGGHDGKWKEAFYDGLHQLNRQVNQVVSSELSGNWEGQLAEDFAGAFYFSGTQNSELSLLAAKASSLGAVISCGTFFDNPQTSGRINVLMARQALENLHDAGYGQVATTIERGLITRFKQGVDPSTNQTLDVVFKDIFTAS